MTLIKSMRPYEPCTECDGEGNNSDGSTCTECCEHFDLDCGHCMECGEDITDSLASDAYDRAKGARYDD